MAFRSCQSVLHKISVCSFSATATVKAVEAEAKGCPAADNTRPAAPGGGGSGRDAAAGPAEFREHDQQDGAEHGLTGAKPRGERG